MNKFVTMWNLLGVKSYVLYRDEIPFEIEREEYGDTDKYLVIILTKKESAVNKVLAYVNEQFGQNLTAKKWSYTEIVNYVIMYKLGGIFMFNNKTFSRYDPKQDNFSINAVNG